MAVPRASKPAAFFFFWFPVLVWMGFIFSCSSVPGKDIPPLFPYQDVAFHCFVYMVLAYLFARAAHHTFTRHGPLVIFFLTLLFGILYGISDEFHQRFISERLASGFDVAIDGIGSFIGSLYHPVMRLFSNDKHKTL